ncbi:MAG: hypothetical protein B0W54_10320 [Cellvibrio sp. 79]|nr:MAG: hypothetical protein B0W54_10320 [Cellvibrio sp. 79]
MSGLYSPLASEQDVRRNPIKSTPDFFSNHHKHNDLFCVIPRILFSDFNQQTSVLHICRFNEESPAFGWAFKSSKEGKYNKASKATLPY